MRLPLLFLFSACLLAPVSTFAAALADGQALYQAYCQVCHGAEGKGDGEGVPEATIRPRPFSAGVFKFDTDADWQKGSDADLANVIRNGTAAYGGSQLMPAWSNLTDEELVELVGYIRELQAVQQ